MQRRLLSVQTFRYSCFVHFASVQNTYVKQLCDALYPLFLVQRYTCRDDDQFAPQSRFYELFRTCYYYSHIFSSTIRSIARQKALSALNSDVAINSPSSEKKTNRFPFSREGMMQLRPLHTKISFFIMLSV